MMLNKLDRLCVTIRYHLNYIVTVVFLFMNMLVQEMPLAVVF